MIVYVVWLFLMILFLITTFRPKVEYLEMALVTILVFMVLPGIPLLYLKRRERKVKVLLDPYLASVRQKLADINRYFKGETSVSWSPVITLSYEALLSIMEKMLIDVMGVSGVKVIEEYRAKKQLHISALAKILKEKGKLTDEELKDIEVFRDLRNRVVHEDYHPTKEQARWTAELVQKIVKKHYPLLM